MPLTFTIADQDSAPETLVDELIAACRERYEVTVEEVRTTEESVVFKLPRQLVA